jgi:hypothetical protein
MKWEVVLWILVATTLSACAGDSASHHVERSGGFTLAAPVDKAFPLFEPVPEKQWVEGWDPKPVYPANGDTVEGMVFTSSHENASDTVWTMAHFDPARHEITYVNVTAGVRLGRIDIRCSDASGSTHVDVRYSFTSLSDAGNEVVDSFSQSRFDAHMQAWQHALTYFLQTGKRFEHHAQPRL